MYKNTFEYVNELTGKTVREDIYFNINLAEAMQMLMYDNLAEKLHNLGHMDAESHVDRKTSYETFEWIVSKAYGIRVDDEFEKSEEISRKFTTSDRYSAVLEWLMFDENSEDNASTFINSLFPSKLMDNAQKLLDKKNQENAE